VWQLVSLGGCSVLLGDAQSIESPRNAAHELGEVKWWMQRVGFLGDF
jgi:hypothetical protein